MKWSDKEMVHTDSYGILHLCRADQAKGPVGVKFYCPLCKRYVREDNTTHTLRLRHDLLPTLDELWEKRAGNRSRFDYARMVFVNRIPKHLFANYLRKTGVRFRE